ncbi:hypothetical protein ACFQO7_31015 [Catellatospora aurea]|uniref:ATP-binding protein n=1 Tax=Catellatospora aurea TaxID=1337874 RepID=A0ABW2H3U0_9ACTN
MKTGNPDGGVEWYDVSPSGYVHGFQAKFVDSVDNLISQARGSLVTVGANRLERNIVKMTFCAPFDMPEQAPQQRKRKIQSARTRWNNAVERWREDIPGLQDVEIDFVEGGVLLERLTRPGNEGRRLFFFNELTFGRDWCRQQVSRSRNQVRDRYSERHHIDLPVIDTVEGLTVGKLFLDDLKTLGQRLEQDVERRLHAVGQWIEQHGKIAWQAATGRPVKSLESMVGLTAACLSQLQSIGRFRQFTSENFPADDLQRDVVTLRAGVHTLGRELRSLSKALSAGAAEAPGSDDGDSAAFQSGSGPDGQDGPLSAAQSSLRDLVEEWRWERVSSAAGELHELLAGDRGSAAESAVWLLSGPAGQGKTHTVVDAALKHVSRGGLALVMLGEQMRDADPLMELMRICGLGDVPSEVALQAMNAAGETSGSRFLLAFDAINDCDEPRRWRTDLPALMDKIRDYPHVALAVTCRTTLLEVVLPRNWETLGLVHTEHPGFDGHEVEALERYLEGVPHALPRIPMLLPAFTNPLFLKLYTDGLAKRARQTGVVQVSGTQHRSEVFDDFVNFREHDICHELRLDPGERLVGRAVEVLAEQMATSGAEVLPRELARSLVDDLLPSRTQWPDTLFGKLVSHGVLSTERMYRDGEFFPGVSFPYQAFSDDRVMRALLRQHGGEVEKLRDGSALPADSALRRVLLEVSPNLREAATILLPEITGVELVDAVGMAVPADDSSVDAVNLEALRAFVDTLPLRSVVSVSARTLEIFEALPDGWFGSVGLNALLTVSTEPRHPLNADYLHRRLLRQTAADRDADWGIKIYDTLSDVKSLQRLLRWAERLPTPQRLCPGGATPTSVRALGGRRAGGHTEPVPAQASLPAEVVRLAATVLTWTFVSSNRHVRDRATKALGQLLLGYPQTMIGLVEQFLRTDALAVDDSYVFDRLVLASYGVVLRCGPAYAKSDLTELGRKVALYVYADQASPTHASRSLMLCNAAAGLLQELGRLGALEPDEVAVATHPHFAPEVGDAPSEEELDQRYPRDDPEQGWLTLGLSLHPQGDFGDYEVEPLIRRISQLPLTRQRPTATGRCRRQLAADRLDRFAASLPEEVRATLGSSEGANKLLDRLAIAELVLDDNQLELLNGCVLPTPADEVLFDLDQDAEFANRWIFERVASLGWTTRRFGQFDRHHVRGRGRSPHKPERVGKKYQWVGLFELGERLVNHYHLSSDLDHEPDRVAGWQLYQRDLDPSLPPAPHRLPGSDRTAAGDETEATFPASAPGFWAPPAPTLPPIEETTEWITSERDLPDLGTYAERVDEHQAAWVVLDELADDTLGGRGQAFKQALPQQWHHINSWLIRPSQMSAMLTHLDGVSLVPRWMPDGRTPSYIYLGEFPHAYAAHDSSSEFGDDDEHQVRYTDHYAPQVPNPHSRVDAMRTLKSRPSLSRLLATEDLEPEAKLRMVADRWFPTIDAQDHADEQEPTSNDADEIAIDDILDLIGSYAGSSNEQQVPASERTLRDEHGNPILAAPATQHYHWSGDSSDCSLHVGVNVALPANPLLADEGLRRHPDRPDWYSAAGDLVITYRWASRPTGDVRTLLVRRDWLQRRLHQLGFGLIIGLFGERQVTVERPPVWSTFSQAAGLDPHRGAIQVGHRVWRQRNAR